MVLPGATVQFFCCSCGKVTKIQYGKTKGYDERYEHWMCAKCNKQVERRMGLDSARS